MRIILILIMGVSLTGVKAQNPMVNNLKGTWQGQGSLKGAETKFQMSWEEELDAKFIRLSFISKRIVDSTKSSIFKASAMYKPGKDSWTGTWYDSRGIVLSLKGEVENNKLTIDWGDDQTERGRTAYQVLNSSEMEVTDFVLINGEYKKFGEATYKKIDADNDKPQVTGIGGIFFKTPNTEKTREWYQNNLGIVNGNHGGSFLWRKYNDQENYGFTVWHALDAKDDYFKESRKDFMVNYRVNDLDRLLKYLKEQNVKILGEIETYPFGRFAWIIDPDGQKIELWEPVDPDFLELTNDKGEQVYNLSN